MMAGTCNKMNGAFRTKKLKKNKQTNKNDFIIKVFLQGLDSSPTSLWTVGTNPMLPLPSHCSPQVGSDLLTCLFFWRDCQIFGFHQRFSLSSLQFSACVDNITVAGRVCVYILGWFLQSDWKESRFFRIKTFIFVVPRSGRHFHSASSETQSSAFIGCQKNEVCPWRPNNKLTRSLVHGRGWSSTIAVSQSFHVSLSSFWQFFFLLSQWLLQSVLLWRCVVLHFKYAVEPLLACHWHARHPTCFFGGGISATLVHGFCRQSGFKTKRRKKPWLPQGAETMERATNFPCWQGAGCKAGSVPC